MRLESFTPPEPSPDELRRAAEADVFPINPRRSGWGYYQLRFGLIAYKACVKLLATKSGRLQLPTSDMRNTPATIQAQLIQGAKYITDGGHVHLAAHIPGLEEEEKAKVLAALGRMSVNKRKATIIITLPLEDYDESEAILNGLEEVQVDAVKADEMDRAEFRLKLEAFLDGPDGHVFSPNDELQHYPNVPPEEFERLEKIIAQRADREKFLMDYDVGPKTLYLTKLSEEQLEKL